MSGKNQLEEEIESSECSRRTALQTLGVAGLGLAGSVVATGNSEAAGPTAVIAADELPAVDGESVTFDGSGSSGTIDTYEWYVRNNDIENKDGYSGYSGSPQATGESFSLAFGEYAYSVKLIVTDTDGNTSSAEVHFIVDSSWAPEAQIKAHTADGIRTFTGRGSAAPGSTVESYDWYVRNDDRDNGFGYYDTAPSIALRFGDYQFTVKLEVTYEDGTVASDTVTFQG